MATFPQLDGQLTDVAYAARQKIVVLPKHQLADLTKALSRTPQPKNEQPVDSEGSTSTVLQLASSLPPSRVGALLLGGVLVARLEPEIRRHWRRWRTARKLDLDVIYIDTDSASNIRFPAGHPVHSMLYIAHPTNAERYLVAAQFHRNAFEDKVAEAIGLLQGLGATKLTVHHVTGWKRDVSVSMGSEGIEQVAVDATVEGTKATNSTVLYEAEYDPGHEPKLPDDLHWFHDEPLWRKLAEGRLQANLRTFSLDVTYQQDFGIDVDLPAKVQKAGFKLGGEFKRHQSTHWRITGEFTP